MMMHSLFEKLEDRICDIVKAEICNAALDIILENGIANATVKQIASRAGVSVGTVYNHFHDKQSLILYLCDIITEKLLLKLDSYVTLDIPAPDKLRNILTELFDCSKEFIVFCELDGYKDLAMINNKQIAFVHKKIISIIEKILNEGVSGGIFKIDNVAVMAKLCLLSFSCSGRLEGYIGSNNPFPSEVLIKDVFCMINMEN